MSTLDELMNRDPFDYSNADLDEIIAYHRQQRRNLEAGIKPKKEEGPKVSLDAVMASLTQNEVVSVAAPTTTGKVDRRF